MLTISASTRLMVEWVKGTRTKEIKYIQLATKKAAVVLQWNVRFVSSSRKSVEGWGFMVVMGILIKCGVRVYGGNGFGTLVKENCWIRSLSWNLGVFQIHSLLVTSDGFLCLVVCHFQKYLMADCKDCRRGWFPLVRHVPSFRTKYAIPEKFD